MSVPAVPRRSASEDVADRLRLHVAREGLRPGDRLGREEDLARALGVSRPTLREGLALLSGSHLLRASKGPGGGIFVAATPEEGISRSLTDSVRSMLSTDAITVDELLETRLLLDVPLAGLAAQRAAPDDVARLEALLEVHADDLPALDAALHRELTAIAGNRLAGALTHWVVEALQPRLLALVAPALVPEVVAEQHAAVVRAIARGDAGAAERAEREHLTYLRDLAEVVRDG